MVMAIIKDAHELKIAGVVASTLPNIIMVSVAVGFFSSAMRRFINHSISSSNSRGAQTENRTNDTLRTFRFPFFVLGTSALTETWFSENTINGGYGTYMASLAIAAYLGSSSNGTLDRLKQWISGRRQKITMTLANPDAKTANCTVPEAISKNLGLEIPRH